MLTNNAPPLAISASIAPFEHNATHPIIIAIHPNIAYPSNLHSDHTMSELEPPKPAPPLKLPRTPYNEDEIVNLMKELYKTFLRLNYIKRWEVIWPPKGTGHAINEVLCREIGLDQAVISLMKQLPYIKGSLVSMDIEVYKYSRAMVYLEDDEIRGGRDPTHPGKDAPTNYVYKPERPDDKYHYRNYYPHHAPTWLANWVAKIKSLDEVVPVRAGAGGSSLHWIDPRYPPRNEATIVRGLLRDKYGYPDDFREAEWRSIGEKICWMIGHAIMDGKKIPKEFDVDPKEEEKEAREYAGTVVYAEEIDGPMDGPRRFHDFLYQDQTI
ncbi:hypothetical protein ASPCAL12312 [Aspergillus calidoustus]|uniref:Uncharacterized protein n=1 Tax=Aspergillus calidoustus TaxID=454130 RepID=A0A0U5H5F7_ASPCI|nr:hypothetical protein ASPCAL12312 [Aspergillus calidoustus]